MAAVSYKCPSCGGPLKWDAGKQKYSCEYCRSEFTEEALSGINAESADAGILSSEEAAAAGFSGEAVGEDKVRVYSCPSCGAQIVTDATTAASFCYYCHNPVVLTERLEGGFHPDCILPFAIDRKKALSIFSGWIEKHKYIPEDFYSEQQIEHLSGVYFPYWIYNAKVKGTVRGKGMNDHTFRTAKEQITDTTIYEIDRSGEMPVRNISRVALKKASKVLCESVIPFDQEKMKPFSYGYLSGYMAETRDIEKEDAAPEIRREVKEFAAAQLRQSATEGFARSQISEVTTTVAQENWKYALMPVWTLTYKGDDGKMYYFSINGESGKTVGELPLNKKKLFGLFLRTAVPVLIGLILLFHFIG